MVSPFLPTPVWASGTGHEAGQPAQGSPEAGDPTSETGQETDLGPIRYEQARWEDWEAVVPGPYAQSSKDDEKAGRGYSVNQDGKMRTADATILPDSKPTRIIITVTERKVGSDGNLPKTPDNSQLKTVDFSSVLKEWQTIVRILATDAHALPLTFCATGETSASGPECDGVSIGTTLRLELSDGTTKLVMIEDGEIRGFIDVPNNIQIKDVIGLNSNNGSVLIHGQDELSQEDMLYIFSSSFAGSLAERFRLFRPEGWSGNPVQIEVISHDSKSVIVVVDRVAGTVSYFQSDNGTSEPGSFKLIRTASPNNLDNLQYEAQGNMLVILEVVPGQNFLIVNVVRLNQDGTTQRTASGEYIFTPPGLDSLSNIKLLGSTNPYDNQMIIYIVATVGGESLLMASVFDAAQELGTNGVWQVLGPYDGESPDQLNSTVIIPRPQGPATLANQVGVSEPRHTLFTPLVYQQGNSASDVLSRQGLTYSSLGDNSRGKRSPKEQQFSKNQQQTMNNWNRRA